MSLFPRAFYTSDTSFTPLFRLLDDFDTYSREVQGQESRRPGRAAASFNPKFDLRETENAYELHGELPGVERENVNIEFTDPQTIVVHGRVERSYTAGTPPAGFIEVPHETAAITEGEGEGKGKAKSPEETSGAAAAPREKYWVSERSVGEFTRSFNFPAPVDHDGVTAGLNNGVLSVTVPKARKRETRRIAIH